MNRTFFAFKCGIIWICDGEVVYYSVNLVGGGDDVYTNASTYNTVVVTPSVITYLSIQHYILTLNPPVHTYLVLTPLLHITYLLLDNILLSHTHHTPYAYISHKYHARWCPYSVYIWGERCRAFYSSNTDLHYRLYISIFYPIWIKIPIWWFLLLNRFFTSIRYILI